MTIPSADSPENAMAELDQLALACVRCAGQGATITIDGMTAYVAADSALLALIEREKLKLERLPRHG